MGDVPGEGEPFGKGVEAGVARRCAAQCVERTDPDAGDESRDRASIYHLSAIRFWKWGRVSAAERGR
jgi:hypothetical protein